MMMKTPSQRTAGPHQAGFSLVEGLMAAALMLVVAVSILPLFMRALESNTRGGRASQVSTLATAELETINQASVDRPDWQLEGSTIGVLDLDTRWWDPGPVFDGASHAQIGDEEWVDDRGDADGPVLWSRDLAIRKYSFADIHLSIKVGDQVLNTLGDPRLFDRPLVTDDDGDLYEAHITEFRVNLREDREGTPLDMGQRMTIGHFRTF